jgi:hypothetical protein
MLGLRQGYRSTLLELPVLLHVSGGEHASKELISLETSFMVGTNNFICFCKLHRRYERRVQLTAMMFFHFLVGAALALTATASPVGEQQLVFDGGVGRQQVDLIREFVLLLRIQQAIFAMKEPID